MTTLTLSVNCQTGAAKSAAPTSLSWMAPAAVSLAMFLAVASSMAPSPLYQAYREEWGFSTAVITGLYGAYCVMVLVTLLLGGAITDRFNRRRVIVAGLLLVASGLVLMITAAGLPSLLAGRLMAGAGTGTLSGAATAALSELLGKKDSRVAATLSAMVYSGGAAFGPTLSSVAIYFDLWPTKLPFMVLLALVAVAILWLATVIWPLPAIGPQRLEWRAWRPRSVSVPPATRPVFRTVALTLALAWGVASLFNALGPTMIRETLHINVPWLGGVMIVVFQMIAGLTPLYCRRLDARRVLALCAPALALSMCLCVIAIYCTSVPLFAAAAVLSAVACGAVFAAGVDSLTVHTDSHHRGETLCALYVAGYLGGAVPVFCVGLGSDLIGMSLILALSAVVTVTAAAWIMITLPNRLP